MYIFRQREIDNVLIITGDGTGGHCGDDGGAGGGSGGDGGGGGGCVVVCMVGPYCK